MKNILKNTILLFLLVFAVMIVPKTFANITSGQKGTVTVSGIKEAGTTINLYKIIDVHFDTANQQPTEPVYTWNSAVGAWIMSGTNTTFKSYVKEVTSGSPSTTTYEVKAEFNSSKSNKEEIATFYKAVEDAIKNGEITLSPAKTKSDTVKGTNTISDVEMGGYLISIPKKGDYTYNPSAANVFPKYKNSTDKWVIQNGEAVAKASTPQIEKKIRDNDKYLESIQTWIGKEIPFTVDVDVPNYPSDKEHKELKISDTFAPGLTYLKNLKVYGVYGGAISGTLTEGVNYRITSSATTNGFVLEINNTEYETLVDAEGHKYEELHLEYSGTLNENAAVSTGNLNTATYDYDNNEGHDSDSVTVYTYGIKIHKFKLENGAYDILPGAVFKLTDTEGKIGSAGSILKFKPVTGETGVYYYDPSGEEEITVPASGKLVLKGLPEGKYTLEETKAPDGGYVKLQQPIEIVIKDAVTTGEGDSAVTTYDGKVDDALNTSFTNQKDYITDDGLADQDVVNSQGFELPVTGGIGTLLFSVLGIVFMGIAALLVKSIFKGKKVENN